MAVMMHYFKWSFVMTGIGLTLAAVLGYVLKGGMPGALAYLLVGSVLAVLEISLSFDNAIVNANTLKRMSEVWQHRFLTWGILIAVFGMRLFFPLLIVVVAAGIGPWEAIRLSVAAPDQYATIIDGAHVSIAGFGGAFLMMVGLRFFFDADKEVHWIGPIERAAARFSGIRGIEMTVILSAMLIVAMLLPRAEVATFLFAGIAGLVTYLVVDVIGYLLDSPHDVLAGTAKAGFGAFLYLEVLDASFSFDGVIGAFALTQDMLLIAVGLGIGAMYVRSMTIMLVDKGTLSEFRYLEHGAFWSILILSFIMFAQTMIEVPEYVTGLLGAGFIAASFGSSLRVRQPIAP